jgi:hypothetical protein
MSTKIYQGSKKNKLLASPFTNKPTYMSIIPIRLYYVHAGDQDGGAFGFPTHKLGREKWRHICSSDHLETG